MLFVAFFRAFLAVVIGSLCAFCGVFVTFLVVIGSLFFFCAFPRVALEKRASVVLAQ